jgi:hypothetical protein
MVVGQPQLVPTLLAILLAQTVAAQAAAHTSPTAARRAAQILLALAARTPSLHDLLRSHAWLFIQMAGSEHPAVAGPANDILLELAEH